MRSVRMRAPKSARLRVRALLCAIVLAFGWTAEAVAQCEHHGLPTSGVYTAAASAHADHHAPGSEEESHPEGCTCLGSCTPAGLALPAPVTAEAYFPATSPKAAVRGATGRVMIPARLPFILPPATAPPARQQL